MSLDTREHAVPCKSCGGKTYAKDRVCGFCRPDGHEAAAARDEFMEERYA